MFVERRDLPNFEFAVVPGVVGQVFSRGDGLQRYDFDVARGDGEQMIRTTKVGGESQIVNGFCAPNGRPEKKTIQS